MEEKLFQFCDYIRPNQEYIVHCDKTVEAIYSLLKNKSKFGLQSFHMGGGIPSGKDTSTTLKVDADVVVNVVEDLSSPREIPDSKDLILKEWKRILEENTECDDKDDVIMRTINSLHFRYRGVWIDLLVSLVQDSDPEKNLASIHGILGHLEDICTVDQEREKLKKSLGADLNLAGVDFMRRRSRFVVDISRLAKFWSQTVYYEGCRNGKSFLVELVAVKAAMEEEESSVVQVKALRSSDKLNSVMEEEAKGLPTNSQLSYVGAFLGFLKLMEDLGTINVVFDEYYSKEAISEEILSQVPLLLNPVNPHQNLAAELTDEVYRDTMRTAARVTIEKLRSEKSDVEELFQPQNTSQFNQLSLRNITLDFVESSELKAELMPTIEFHSLWLRPKIGGRNRTEILADRYHETKRLLLQVQRMVGSVVRCRMFSHPESSLGDIERSVQLFLKGVSPLWRITRREGGGLRGKDVTVKIPLRVQSRGEVMKLEFNLISSLSLAD